MWVWRRRLAHRRNGDKKITEPPDADREDDMAALLAIGTMLAIWVVVIWGSIYFNQNVH
jgi:hypothetical protein